MLRIPLSKSKTTIIGVTVLLIVSNSVFAARSDPGRGQFAYVANENSDSVSGYKLNASTGALWPSHGFSFGNEPTGPSWVVTDPAGRFLYATEPFGGVNAIAGFQIERPSGRLTPIPGTPFGDHNPPEAMAIDPTGRFAYAVNQGSNNVSAYAIRPNTGRLAPISGSPFTTGDSPSAVAVDPSGKFVYVTNELSATISSFTIDAHSGALTPIAGNPPATGLSPVSIAIDPNDRLVYVAGIGSGNVSGYSINPTTGALTMLGTSPYAAGAGGLDGISFDPSGKYVYVAGFGGIFSFAINLNPEAFAFTGGSPVQLFGQLTLIAGSPFGGGNPASIVVDYTGAFAYVADKSSNQIAAFTLSGGKLTANSQTPIVDAGSLPVSIALVRPESVPGYTASRIPQTTSAGFPTQSMVASAINSQGDVTGSVVYYPTSGENFAFGFLYSGGATISVGEFAGNHFSAAFALNDNNQVVGQMTLSPPMVNERPVQAFLFSNGTTTDIDTVVGRQSSATSINNGGQLTGSFSIGVCSIICNLPGHAFLDRGSGLMDLGTLAGGTFSAGGSINNGGAIFGTADVSDGSIHLFRYSNESMHDLGTLRGYNINGATANDNGEVVGTASSATSSTGYFFQNGAFHALAFTPHGLNNRGDIAGMRTSASGGQEAVIDKGDGVLDLNRLVDPSLTYLTGAADVNNRGQIVVSGLDGNLYVLTPSK